MRFVLILCLWAAVAGIGFSVPARAEDPVSLRVVSFNVESDRDTDPRTVGGDIRRIGSAVDLFGLAEVRNAEDLALFAGAAEQAAGAVFGAVLAKAGGEDRLGLLFNRSTLEAGRIWELSHVPGSRKLLIGRFRHKASGVDFLFGVNHFNRRDGERRRRQAAMIRDWVLRQELPVILTGDYNFDFDPVRGRGNRAYGIFTADAALRWIKPACIAQRSCPATGTQCDRRFNSIMDFVFVADRGRGWPGESRVMLNDPAYCDRERQGHADHFPVMATIRLK